MSSAELRDGREGRDGKEDRRLREGKEDRRLKAFQGKRITQQLTCQPHPLKLRSKPHQLSRETPQLDTFRTILSKNDRHKESQTKLDIRLGQLIHNEPKDNRHILKDCKHISGKEGSKSRSKSGAMNKSKSMKQLGKKSKSMVRLDPRRRLPREEGRCQSPTGHAKSTTSHGQRKQCKSHYQSKTTREMASEVTTDRERHKLQSAKGPKRPPSKKQSGKENLKVEGEVKPKAKGKRPKKEKRVLISQQHSKLRREQEDWELSLNEEEFLNPRHPKNKLKAKASNIVDIPRRKERLSLNPSCPRKRILKNKTEVELEHSHPHRQYLETQAAITIQKVFRGYLTRKYIRECFEHNAVIKIQKYWRAKRARRQQRESLERKSEKPPQMMEQQEYLLQGSSSKSSAHEQWASMLGQILEEDSLSSNIKAKIELFLLTQQRPVPEFEAVKALRSPSARSSISSQLIYNEMASERQFIEQERMRFIEQERMRFIEKERMKRGRFEDPEQLISPRQYMSPREGIYSAFVHFSSPQNRLSRQSDTQLLVCNLKSIQKRHRATMQRQAGCEKEELNQQLIKHCLSPRTHEKMFRKVGQSLEDELDKFSQSINQIVTNCILHDEASQQLQTDPLTTPKRELQQLQLPPDNASAQEMSVEFREYYQSRGQSEDKQEIDLGAEKEGKYLEEDKGDKGYKGDNVDKDYKEDNVDKDFKEDREEKEEEEGQPFETSYQFVEEYLISLIDFLRQYEGGRVVRAVISGLQKSRSHEMATIMRNSRLVSENSEEEDPDSSFRLPMYKYMDLEEPIFEDQLIEQFNACCPKLLKLSDPSASLQKHFLKMVAEVMNEALNELRPQNYPFAQAALPAVNSLKALATIPFEGEASPQEMHFQYVCAQALNKIFYWNKLEWGRGQRVGQEEGAHGEDQEEGGQRVGQEEGGHGEELRACLVREMETSIAQVYAQEQWHFYEEMIEMIGLLGQETFETVVFEEIASIWGVILEWKHKIGRPSILIPVGTDHLD